MSHSHLFTILSCVIFGVLSRLLPHPPNFTAINAIALFSACSFASLPLALFTTVTTMLLSDAIFGFHSSMLFVYVSFGLITLMGHWCNSSKSVSRLTVSLVFSSFLFFFLTNFGDWMTTQMYPKTGSGLLLCYTAGLPFLANQILGDLFYGATIFAIQHAFNAEKAEDGWVRGLR